MRKHISVAVAAFALFFLAAATALAAPQPDAPPAAHRPALICPGAPYERVQWVESIYRITGDQLTLVSQRRLGQPFLIGGYNPQHCRHLRERKRLHPKLAIRSRHSAR